MALGMMSGFSTSCRRCSGCSARKENMQSRVAVTVSRPAIRREEADVEDVVVDEATALHLGLEELGQDVVPRSLALGEDPVEVVVDLIGGFFL